MADWDRVRNVYFNYAASLYIDTFHKVLLKWQSLQLKQPMAAIFVNASRLFGSNGYGDMYVYLLMEATCILIITFA